MNEWPIFAPINITFDRDKLRKEILESKILDKGNVATSHLRGDKNFWDNGVNFQDEKFSKLNDVPLWADETRQELVKKDIDTFHQVTLTTPDESILTDVWTGTHQEKTKIPLWIKDHYPWKFREDVNLPYLKEIVNSLGMEFISMIRIVYQNPPSIGLLHRDSGPKTNRDYFNAGGVNITLNASSGGANLYFLDGENKELNINEEETPIWHFNDATLHCTTEVTSERIQVRVYGKHSNYQGLMDLSKAVY